MTCKDCIHYEACCNWTEEEHGAMEMTTTEQSCNYFKDKSKFIELPCKVGDDTFQVEGKAQDPLYADCPLPDAEETKHGKWIYENKPIHCSECGFTPTYSLNCENALFCSHCGARMDGKTNERKK